MHGQEDFAESYLHTAEDRAGFREFLDGAITRDLANIQRSYVERAGSNFWIAELEGKAVGCIGIYRRSDEEAEIRRLAVDRSVRRMGIASRLLGPGRRVCPGRWIRSYDGVDGQSPHRRDEFPGTSRLPGDRRPRLPAHQPDTVSVRAGLVTRCMNSAMLVWLRLIMVVRS